MGKRYFTVAEANTLLPWLEQALGRALMLRSGLRSAAAELERLGAPLTDESLQHQGGEATVANARARAKGLIEALSDELQRLVEAGVEVKDLETGLCDFHRPPRRARRVPVLATGREAGGPLARARHRPRGTPAARERGHAPAALGRR